MSGRLADKIAVVSGAGSGIGRATAIRFAAEGAQVAVLDINGGAAAHTAEECISPTALAVTTDVTVEEEVQGAFARVREAWGHVDIVVANAGIQLFGQDSRIHELSSEAWDRTIAVNLRGAFLLCKHGVRALLQAGGGSLICTASPTGLFGIDPEFTAYSSSKAGVYGLTRVVAAGYAADKIRANAVFPGFIDTPLVRRAIEDPRVLAEANSHIPLGRPGHPEEVAAMMVFLASDESSYATGGAFFVDGGITAI